MTYKDPTHRYDIYASDSRLVKAVRAFWIAPQAYWYRDAPRRAGERFNLDDPEHYAYLQRKGVAKVELYDGTTVTIPPLGKETK